MKSKSRKSRQAPPLLLPRPHRSLRRLPRLLRQHLRQLPRRAAPAGKAGAVKVTAPMPGNILKVNVEVGQKVSKGDVLCILEAMKMENDIPCPQDGTVASVNVQKGATVNSGDVLVTLN